MSKPEIIEAPLTVAPVSSGEHVFIEGEATQIRTVKGHWGETQLDKFAGLVLQGFVARNAILNSGNMPSLNCNKVCLAEFCYDVAEHMIDEKKKREAK